MKVLFYSPLAVLSWHHETDLELIQLHLDRGDVVTVLDCRGTLKKIGFSGCTAIGRCQLCISRQSEGLQLLSPQKYLLETIEVPSVKVENWKFSTKKDLHGIHYEGVDIGSAVLSTLISNLREPDPDLGKYYKEINRMLSNMVSLTDSCMRILSSHKPDRIYFFNGRFNIYRPMLRLAQKNKIECMVHERGGALNKYELSLNTYPHDLEYGKFCIEKIWEESSLQLNEKIKISANWFEIRQKGINQAWFSFTDKQKQGYLPENFDISKRNITIFISSEDEFEAISGWENPIFKDQTEAVDYILANIQNSDIHFFIRIHPNLKGLINSQTKSINRWKKDNTTIIAAESMVNSYSLMFASEKIITFGSTVGAEAVYAGIPSILAGRALYEDLGGIIRPKTVIELIKVITDPPNKPDRNEIMKFAFWASEFGIKFRYFKPSNLSNGEFKNHKIKGSSVKFYFSSLMTLLRDLTDVLNGRMDKDYLIKKIKNKI